MMSSSLNCIRYLIGSQWSDVISVAGMGEQTSSRVLDVLEFSFFLVINCFFIFLLFTEVGLRQCVASAENDR